MANVMEFCSRAEVKTVKNEIQKPVFASFMVGNCNFGAPGELEREQR